jgi:hypothetical protein
MPAFRFVGAHAQIYDTPYVFTRFGQLVELPEDLARRVILERVRLVPASVWDGLGITEAEIQKPGPDFAAKKRAAWAAAEAHHASLLDPASDSGPAGEPEAQKDIEHIAEA